MLKGQRKGQLVLWSSASLCLLATAVAAPAVSFAQQNNPNWTAPLNTLNDAQKTYAGVSGMVSEMHQYGLASRAKAAQALEQIRSDVLQVRSSDKVPHDLLHSTLIAIDEAQTALKTDSAPTISWSLQTVGLEVQDLQAKLTGQKPPVETASQERPTMTGGGTRAPDQSSTAREQPKPIVAEAERKTGVVTQTPQAPNSNLENRVADERGQSGPMQQAAPEKPMEKTAQAPAQSPQQPASQKQANTAANQPAPQNALASMQRSSVVGKELYDHDGNPVASIQDVKMGPDGKIQAVEVDVGGFLGIGSRRVSVPADAIQVKGDRIESSWSTERIRDLPSDAK